MVTGSKSVPELEKLRSYAAVIGDRRSMGDGNIAVVDPATGTAFAEIADCGPSEVDAAVRAAATAFGPWAGLGQTERSSHLRRLAEVLRAHTDELAELNTRDVGKPLQQSRSEVALAARIFDYYADAATTLLGHSIPVSKDVFGYTVHEPYGVVGHIVPWNYPLGIAARTIAPALAVGNCSVVKPAEDASLAVLRLAELALEAGLPPGTLNVITGVGATAGAALAQHTGIALLSFTGSVGTGRAVAKAAAENCIPVMLELGGKSPNIVFADADLPAAVDAVVNTIIQNAGQTCSAGTRLIVEDSIHRRVVEALHERFESVRIGPGMDDPDLGPLISQRQLVRVRELVEAGKQEAELVVGGSALTGEGLDGGYFFAPTIFDHVGIETQIAQEEVFGPVLAVTPFSELDEARELADGTRYGLAAGIWTKDGSKAHWLAHQLKSGQVFLNTYGGGAVELPFGGYKLSGYGREKGTEALIEYTQIKSIAVRTKP
ncbi:aldehyde dehydrogenase family protein [Nocardia pseudovaccinii]|uniref:aldehyde dehydrogenase family protein n=1 Tax=Nocardia pseudovaccinii TaxID=189540 RepID=UPI003D913080